jgi:4-hydroxybenzoate polyprenyltransferase
MIRSVGLVLMAILFGLGIAAYALRWLWLAMIAVALLISAYSEFLKQNWG